MPMTDKNEWQALRPDAQAFDEIRIITVPRYKQSGLSGDEWRISAEIQLWRKGIKITERSCRNVETACLILGAFWCEACDGGEGYFAGDGKSCDQEGCAQAATVRYRLEKLYCLEGHPSEPSEPTYRHFCDVHKTRGDCGFEDADRNYLSEPPG